MGVKKNEKMLLTLTFHCEQKQAFDDFPSKYHLGVHQFCFPCTLHKPAIQSRFHLRNPKNQEIAITNNKNARQKCYLGRKAKANVCNKHTKT